MSGAFAWTLFNSLFFFNKIKAQKTKLRAYELIINFMSNKFSKNQRFQNTYIYI